jgi:hypothetical protein
MSGPKSVGVSGDTIAYARGAQSENSHDDRSAEDAESCYQFD